MSLTYSDLLTARIIHRHFDIAFTGRKGFDGEIGWCSDNGAGWLNTGTVSTDPIVVGCVKQKPELIQKSKDE